MRVSVILFLAIMVVVLYRTGMAQSKSKTTEWINTQGEEILRDITGNSSIQWQMDEYGRLKITNYKPKREDESNIVKRYSYLNLYELDLKGVLIENSTENKNMNRLLVQCKTRKKACIKSRHYVTDTDFKTFATSSLAFQLKQQFDSTKVELLEKMLEQAVKIFQKDTFSDQ